MSGSGRQPRAPVASVLVQLNLPPGGLESLPPEQQEALARQIIASSGAPLPQGVSLHLVRNQPPLHKAVRDVAELRRLLAAGEEVDVQDESGVTALWRAVNCQQHQAVAVLLDAGARVDVADCDGDSALHCAALVGDAPLIRQLCEAGADVAAVNLQGRTPLHTAAESGEVEALQALAEAGSDVNAADADGCTPLHVARTPAAALALVHLGAAPKLRNTAGQAAAERAAAGSTALSQQLRREAAAHRRCAACGASGGLHYCSGCRAMSY